MSQTLQPAPGAHNWRRIVPVFVLAATLYSLGVTSHWRIGSDSGRYLVMARQLAEGKGYLFAGKPQWGIPPGVPGYYALVFKLTGFKPSVDGLTEGFTSANVAGVVWGYAGLIMAYLFVSEISDPRRALIVTVFVATSRFFYMENLATLSDVPFSAASWGALWLLARAEKRGGAVQYVLLSLMLAMSALLRLAGAALIIAIGLYCLGRLVFGKRARSAVFALVAAIPAAAVSVFLGLATLSDRRTVAFTYYNQLFEGHTAGQLMRSALRHVMTLPGYVFESIVGLESLAGASLILCAVIAAGLIAFWRSGHRFAPLYFLVYLIFVGAGVGVIPRLLMPLYPILYLFLIEGVTLAGDGARRLFEQRGWRVVSRRGAIAGGFAFFVILINLFYVGKTVSTNFAHDFYAAHAHGKWVDYLPLARAVAEEPGKGRLMLSEFAVVSALSGAEAVTTPYWLANADDPDDLLARYVRENGITGAVYEPTWKNSRLLARFLEEGPIAWKEKGRFGKLIFYTPADAGVKQDPGG